MQTTTFARVLSILGGIGLIGVAGYVNVLHTASFDMQIVVGALAAGTALAAWVFSSMWKDRPGLASLALVGVIAGELYGFVATSERLLFARDHRQATVATSNQVWVQRKEALEYAVSAAKTECASGRGPRCAAAEAKVDSARTVLAGTQVPVEPNRLAAILGWNPVLVDLIPTLAGSVALNLLGFVMMTFGHANRRVEQPKVSAPVPAPHGGNVVEFAAHPVIVALRQGAAESNDELADRLGESKGEASKKRGEVRDLLIEQKIGRRTVIDLKPEIRRALG